ncbi:hypothetical protein JCM6882_009044 [Rhodosporidiobolus microsporus]
MPPDRGTATSFAEAALLGLPLSSHGSKHNPSIARGQACKICRKRKLKCDGVKPLCGACKKSAQAHGDDISSLVCEYDDPLAPKKKRASPGSKVAALEAELAELKAMINGGANSATTQQQQQQQQPPMVTPDLTPPTMDYNSFLGSHNQPARDSTGSSSSSQTSPLFGAPASQPSPPFDIPPSRAPAPFTAWHPPPLVQASPRISTNISGGVSVSVGSSSSDYIISNFIEQSAQLTPPSTSSESPASGNDLFRDLLYPGWPRDLPSPELTMRLVEIFLTRPHICTGLVNAAKFRTSMLLPPTSAGFPHKGLLHMMCSLAAMMVSEDFFMTEERYWPSHQKPTEYHATMAKMALDSSIHSGERLFQVAQTVTLLCFWAYTNARFVELWLYCGQATRILTPLGLNHLRNADDIQTNPAFFKPHLLLPTSDPDELNERAMTFYFAMMSDRFASGSTGWATSLDDADVTTAIPTDNALYPTGNLEESPLSPRSPMFFLAHPPDRCGPLQLMLKAIVLFGRVNAFTQRAPHLTTDASHNQWGLSDPIRDVRDTDAFKRLDALIQSFRSSIPREYQLSSFDPGSGAFNVLDETRLGMLHGMSHLSTILLHEPFVSSLDEGEPSMRKCMEAARQILQAVFKLLSSSYEISLYSPYMNMVWAVAGRTFVRELGMKMAKNDTLGTDEIRSNINTLLMALRAYKTPLGAASAAQLQFLFDDPLRTLPTAFLNPNMFPCSAGFQHPHHTTDECSSSHPSVNTGPAIWKAMEAERAARTREHAFPTPGAHLLSCPIQPAPSHKFMHETELARMNAGFGKESSEALSSFTDSMAKGAAAYMVNFEAETRLRMQEREAQRGAKGAGMGMGGSGASSSSSSAASPQRFEELSGAELAGLETLLGL